MNEQPVTVIVSGRNSASTIRQCLESLTIQDYPIVEILVYDNGSTDGSQAIVRDVAEHAKVPVVLIDGGNEGCLCRSYNRGAARAKGEILVLCHSDGMIPSSGELRKLIEPLVANPDAAAAYPRLLMPRSVWTRFPFWQKFVFVRAVDSISHSRCAIFDAVRKDVFLKAGGFNERRFTATCGYGGEDSDAQLRFSRLGRQLFTEARAVHLHNFSPTYGFRAYLGTRALLARSYGKQLRGQGGVAERSNLLFFVRPALAVSPFLTFGFGFLFQILFALVNAWPMFRHRETLLDGRILLVVPVGVFMIYYESFWFVHGLVTKAADE